MRSNRRSAQLVVLVSLLLLSGAYLLPNYWRVC